MRAILHILTRPADELTQELIRRQRELPQTNVAVVELVAHEADYDELVEKIFTADSVQVS